MAGQENINKLERGAAPDATTPAANNVTGDKVLSGGQTAATQYGKGKLDGAFPSQTDLLDQIKIDQEHHKLPLDQRGYEHERKVAATLTEPERESIGSIVHAIRHGKFQDASAATAGDPNTATIGDALKGFPGTPERLSAIKEMINLELERQQLSKRFQVDVMPYQDAHKQSQAALVITDKNIKNLNKASFGFNTAGVKVDNHLLNFLYD